MAADAMSLISPNSKSTALGEHGNQGADMRTQGSQQKEDMAGYKQADLDNGFMDGNQAPAKPLDFMESGKREEMKPTQGNAFVMNAPKQDAMALITPAMPAQLHMPKADNEGTHDGDGDGY